MNKPIIWAIWDLILAERSKNYLAELLGKSWLADPKLEMIKEEIEKYSNIIGYTIAVNTGLKNEIALLNFWLLTLKRTLQSCEGVCWTGGRWRTENKADWKTKAKATSWDKPRLKIHNSTENRTNRRQNEHISDGFRLISLQDVSNCRCIH